MVVVVVVMEPLPASLADAALLLLSCVLLLLPGDPAPRPSLGGGSAVSLPRTPCCCW